MIAGAGVAIALACLAVDYFVVPALRLRAARRRGSAAVRDLMQSEGLRLDRLRNAAAVREEHGDSDAGALRDEAELRGLVLWMMEGVSRTP